MAGFTESNSKQARLTELRAIAQRHLAEIGQQEELEKHEEEQVQSVLAEEAQRRSAKGVKRRSPSPQGDRAELQKGSKMRSAQDVLDRLRWDPSFDASEYVVGFLDRFGGNLEIRVSEWLNESTEEDWIPQHRIRYFKRTKQGTDDEVIWHRLHRIDKVFGTGGGAR